jgi:hypothetical protein
MTESFAWREHRFEIEWPDAAIREMGGVALEYHGASAQSTDGRRGWHFALSIATPDSEFLDTAREIARHTSGLRILGDDRHIYLWNGRSATRISPNEGRVSIALSPDRHRISTGLDVDLFLMLTFSLLAMLQYRGLFVLHAAGVVSPDGIGVILVAPSDSGKSTVTTSLARAGWDYISDDSIILELAEERVLVSPFRRDFGLDPEAEDLFPGIEARATTQLTDAAKWCIDPTLVFPGRRAEQVEPRLIVVPSIADEPFSTVSAVAPAETLVELLRQSSFLTFDRQATAAYMDVLRRLVSGCRCVRLAAGHDLRDAPGLVIPLLQESLPDLFSADAA